MSKIVVGIHPSEPSHDAVAFARWLAEPVGATIVLATAFPYALGVGRVAEYRRYLEDDLGRTLAAASAPLAGYDAVETRPLADPSAAHALHTLAEDEGAALIVVGSSHRGAIGQMLLGGTAIRTVHGSPCAVAVVPPRHQPSPDAPARRIGCAFDASPEAEAALASAVAAARALHAELDVITAFEAHDYSLPVLRGAPGYVEGIDELGRVASEQLAARVAAVPDYVHADAVFEIGPAARVLAERSADLDLLFVGSRGYGPHAAVLLGSVTQQLFNASSCPVIVLPRGVEPTMPGLFARGAEHSAI
jgi:nucleotide-binding universal stress UspA family protein